MSLLKGCIARLKSPRRGSVADSWNHDPWSLQRPLLRFSGGDSWTIGDACTGTQIFGDTGSGKTSGSGQMIAHSMLRCGFGGLVLTVKSSETQRWKDAMHAAGRSEDLLIFSPEHPHRFNFMEYERTRPGRGGGRTSNIAELFVSLVTAGEGAASAHSHDPFWDRALRQLLRNMIDALRLADVPITLEGMHRLLMSAPGSAEEAESEAWRRDSFLFETLLRAKERLSTSSDPGDRHDLGLTVQYWLTEYTGVMDERTRGNIVSTFTTLADGLLRGDLHTLFCNDLTIRPELTFDGKVIVLDLPEKQFHELGRIAQVIWKRCWQQAVESSGRDRTSRPVFLWIDEAQNFITPDEPKFLETAREHKACCIYMTQSRANYLRALGPGQTAAVDSFLGVPKTRIFHCNGDPETNSWAEKLIADDWKQSLSTTMPGNKAPGAREESGPSHTMHPQRAPRIYAAEFSNLRCGGPPEYRVEAVLFQSGRRFIGGEGNIIRLNFYQRTNTRRVH